MSARLKPHPPTPFADSEPELCSYCAERPVGAVGHPGLTEQVRALPPSYRSLTRLCCTFCGTSWVRRRINSKTFEWWCLAR